MYSKYGLKMKGKVNTMKKIVLTITMLVISLLATVTYLKTTEFCYTENLVEFFTLVTILQAITVRSFRKE